MNNKMKAIAINKAGSPDILKLTEINKPTILEDEILIKQSYAGVNYGDVIRRKRGLFEKDALFTPGFEGVGVVTEVGKKTKNLKIGDKVIYLTKNSGGYAEYISIKDYEAIQINEVTLEDSKLAGLLCVSMTAYYLLKESNLKKGSDILIYGAATGVGLILTQLALVNGLKPIAIVSNETRRKIVHQIDSNIKVINRNKIDISQEVLRLTNTKGVDAIFDCVGNKAYSTNLKVLKKQGIWMYYGSVTGHSNFEGLEILMNSYNLKGFVIFEKINNNACWAKSVYKILDFFEEGKISLEDKILPLNEVAKVHTLIESGNDNTQKYILKI